ncbi:MAG: hypothetical protein ACRCYP_04305 [Alphaproteobacteria bacterium]
MIGDIGFFLKIPQNYLPMVGQTVKGAGYSELLLFLQENNLLESEAGNGFFYDELSDDLKIADLNGRYLKGSSVPCVFGEDTMRKITGKFGAFRVSAQSTSGAFVKTSDAGGKKPNGEGISDDQNINFDSSLGIEGQEGSVSPNVGSVTEPKHMESLICIRFKEDEIESEDITQFPIVQNISKFLALSAEGKEKIDIKFLIEELSSGGTGLDLPIEISDVNQLPEEIALLKEKDEEQDSRINELEGGEVAQSEAIDQLTVDLGKKLDKELTSETVFPNGGKVYVKKPDSTYVLSPLPESTGGGLTLEDVKQDASNEFQHTHAVANVTGLQEELASQSDRISDLEDNPPSGVNEARAREIAKEEIVLDNVQDDLKYQPKGDYVTSLELDSKADKNLQNVDGNSLIENSTPTSVTQFLSVNANTGKIERAKTPAGTGGTLPDDVATKTWVNDNFYDEQEIDQNKLPSKLDVSAFNSYKNSTDTAIADRYTISEADARFAKKTIVHQSQWLNYTFSTAKTLPKTPTDLFAWLKTNLTTFNPNQGILGTPIYSEETSPSALQYLKIPNIWGSLLIKVQFLSSATGLAGKRDLYLDFYGKDGTTGVDEAYLGQYRQRSLSFEKSFVLQKGFGITQLGGLRIFTDFTTDESFVGVNIRIDVQGNSEDPAQ